MKKVISILIIFCFLIIPLNCFAEDNYNIIINGKQLKSTEKPFLFYSRLMVPAQDVLKASGIEYTWDDNNSKLTITGSKKKEIFTAEEKVYYADSIAINNDEYPIRKNNTLFINFSDISKILGKESKWDNTTKTLTIGNNIDFTKSEKIIIGKLKNQLPQPVVSKNTIVNTGSGVNNLQGGITIKSMNFVLKSKSTLDLFKKLNDFAIGKFLYEYAKSHYDIKNEQNILNTYVIYNKKVYYWINNLQDCEKLADVELGRDDGLGDYGKGLPAFPIPPSKRYKFIMDGIEKVTSYSALQSENYGILDEYLIDIRDFKKWFPEFTFTYPSASKYISGTPITIKNKDFKITYKYGFFGDIYKYKTGQTKATSGTGLCAINNNIYIPLKGFIDTIGGVAEFDRQNKICKITTKFSKEYSKVFLNGKQLTEYDNFNDVVQLNDEDAWYSIKDLLEKAPEIDFKQVYKEIRTSGGPMYELTLTFKYNNNTIECELVDDLDSKVDVYEYIENSRNYKAFNYPVVNGQKWDTKLLTVNRNNKTQKCELKIRFGEFIKLLSGKVTTDKQNKIFNATIP